MVSRLFGSPPFIGHYQLKHKSSDQGQTNNLIESSYKCSPWISNQRGLAVLSADFPVVDALCGLESRWKHWIFRSLPVPNRSAEPSMAIHF